MKRTNLRWSLLLSLLILLAMGTPGLAQSYTLIGRPVSAAKTSISGDLVLSGVAGQPESATTLTGGGYTLNGGLQFQGEVDPFNIYIPVIVK